MAIGSRSARSRSTSSRPASRRLPRTSRTRAAGTSGSGWSAPRPDPWGRTNRSAGCSRPADPRPDPLVSSARGGTHRTDDDPDRSDPDQPRRADARRPRAARRPAGHDRPGSSARHCPAPPRGPVEAHRRGEVRRRPRLPRRVVRGDDPLDRDEAFDWSKVVVVTAADIPGENVVSLISDDQPILVPVGGEIQHHSEPLALLAAADRETLRAAKRHVKVRADPLPPMFDPRLSEHVFAHYDIGQGDLEKGFAEADHVVEGTYRVGHQEQLYIENNAMIAVPREDGGVAVHGSLQCPYYIHKAMKRAFRFNE